MSFCQCLYLSSLQFAAFFFNLLNFKPRSGYFNIFCGMKIIYNFAAMITKQNIYLSVELAAEAVSNRAKLEALAFGVMGKLMFGCSVMRKATAREYKSMFHLGTERFKRVLNKAIDEGYVRETPNGYIFSRIRAKGANMPLEFARAWGKNKKSSPVKILEVMDFIRKVVQYDLICKKARIDDAVRRCNNPSDLREYRKAEKLLKRTSHKSLDYRLGGISIKRMEANMHTYRHKASRLVREMEADGWISVTRNAYTPIFADPDSVENPIIVKREELTLLQIHQSDLRGDAKYGYYFWQGGQHGSIMWRTPNFYRPLGEQKIRRLS